MTEFDKANQIILPEPQWQEIVKHGESKLAGDNLSSETGVRKVYGLVAGTQNERTLIVECVFPAKKNVRDQEPYKTYMDRMLELHAIPSKTPLSGRGWITDPKELKGCYDKCDREQLVVLGTYHMHVVPWKHDPLRDTPTHLDAILARNTGLFSFIVSMVDISRPTIRAFYEGLADKEVPILIQSGELATAHA